MKMEGTLSQWDSRSGTGVITPVHGHETYAVTRADFPKGMNPRLGEELLFEKVTGPDGRPCARAVVRPEHASPPSLDRMPDYLPPPVARRRGSGLTPLIIIAVLGGIGFAAWTERSDTANQPTSATTTETRSLLNQWLEKVRAIARKF
ncbi:MAG TPA: hypothetical protein VFW49_13370 [Fluviicoccus sp.]|nr:hypothetical protein [Fluviicoccus sp.]